MVRLIPLPQLALPDRACRLIYDGLDLARRGLGSLAWGPVGRRVVMPLVISLLFEKIEKGTVLLVDQESGRRHVFGQRLGPATKGWDLGTCQSDGHGDGDVPCPAALAADTNNRCPAHHSNGTTLSHLRARRRASTVPRVELVVRSPAFWVRLLLFADMGFVESYMLGEVVCEDLAAFFQLVLANRSRLAGDATTATSRVWASVVALARTTNTLGRARFNAAAHYDLSNDVFAAFLSNDMTYSCPVWSAGAEDGETLERAQGRKLARFVEGCKIRKGDHVLEIGTGWGSFAMEAVRRTGCRVTSVTLSREQQRLARARIAEAGYADRIMVLLMDYRELETHGRGGPYDKVVSIEMLEAVGKDFIGTYFGCVERLLKKDGGIAMFQCITMPEGRWDAYAKGEDFINHYIFPGGHLPTITQLVTHISIESKGTLIVERIENIGGHYARTLRLWKDKFMANFETRIRPAMHAKYPDMTEGDMQVFKRKWEYYFTYCEAGFLTKTLGDVIITVGREGALELMDGIPL